MASIINLTPHSVIVRTAGGDVAYPPSGVVARIKESTSPAQRPSVGPLDVDGIPRPAAKTDPSRVGPLELDGVPVSDVHLDSVEGLPDGPPDLSVPDVYYLVSMPAAMAIAAARLAVGAPPRPDVIYPYGQIRDQSGQIVACTGFARLSGVRRGDVAPADPGHLPTTSAVETHEKMKKIISTVGIGSLYLAVPLGFVAVLLGVLAAIGWAFDAGPWAVTGLATVLVLMFAAGFGMVHRSRPRCLTSADGSRQ